MPCLRRNTASRCVMPPSCGAARTRRGHSRVTACVADATPRRGPGFDVAQLTRGAAPVTRGRARAIRAARLRCTLRASPSKGAPRRETGFPCLVPGPRRLGFGAMRQRQPDRGDGGGRYRGPARQRGRERRARDTRCVGGVCGAGRIAGLAQPCTDQQGAPHSRRRRSLRGLDRRRAAVAALSGASMKKAATCRGFCVAGRARRRLFRPVACGGEPSGP